MTEKGTVLVIDDRSSVLKMMRSLLEEGFEVYTCGSGPEGLSHFRAGPTDLVVTDIRMPEMDGIEVLRQIKKESPETEVVLMTAFGDVSQAVEAIRAGAYDYVLKTNVPDEMPLTLQKALERKRLKEQAAHLQEEVESRFGFCNIVGRSPAMQRAFDLARKAVNTDTTVLLTGESGTGKELFARAIHYSSRRSKGRFQAINCAAMPRELIESELFGHVRGAFSGAMRDKPGLFEHADGGTLLLDEITELAPDVQAKINRVLEEGEVRRVGDTRDRIVDVRIIACTNRDLHDAMNCGEFREDLFFRLNVFPIHLPPLREREGDLPLLIKHFLQEFVGEEADSYVIEPKAMQRILEHSWPGNVRELRNSLERAVVLCDGKRITEDLFSFPAGRLGVEVAAAVPSVPLELPYRAAMDQMTKECQRQYLLAALRAHGGNVTKAAEHAGIERESFHRLMRKCNVRAEDVKRDMSEGPAAC